MKLSNRSFTIVLVLSVLGICFAMAGFNNRWWGFLDRTIAKSEPENGEREEEIPDGFVKHGGVIRPKTDVFGRENRKRGPSKEPYHPGLTPVVNRNTNGNTKSLSKTEGSKELAKNRSMMQVPEPFDLEEYQKDPHKYINDVVAGRVWQPMKPSPNTPSIQRVGRYRHRVIQGESVILEVQATPGMPVHFASERLGQFENQLPTITIKADENGLATTTFKLSSGTRDYVDLVASSPVHSGYARWLIEIGQPRNN